MTKLEAGEPLALGVIVAACVLTVASLTVAIGPVRPGSLAAFVMEVCRFNVPTGRSVVESPLDPARTESFGAATAERGAVVAAQVCSGCHGPVGTRDHAAFAPRLDGLSASYIHGELEEYASGQRRWPIMEAVSRALTPEDRAAAALHYARLRTDSYAGRQDDRAAPLVLHGDPTRAMPSCVSCHGPGGLGLNDAPRLAGRPASDIAHALRMFRQGDRADDVGRPMRSVAGKLTNDEISALAGYWATRPTRDVPPPPRAER